MVHVKLFIVLSGPNPLYLPTHLAPCCPCRHPQVCSGRTGHTEAVQLIYRPAEVSFDELCTAFLNKIDPKQARMTNLLLLCSKKRKSFVPQVGIYTQQLPCGAKAVA